MRLKNDQKYVNVDAVILTYRPDECLGEIVRRLKMQSCPVRQIYLINTRSGEFPEELAKTQGVTVKHIEPEEFDHGATRDLGFALSDADFLVFMTQDAVPADRGLIGELMKPLLASDRVGIAYARQLPAKDCDVIERYTRSFNYPKESRIKGQEDMEELGIKTFFCSDVCAAYNREIYHKMGGFTKKTIFNEDMIMAARMVRSGYQIAYAAEARVIHSHNYSGIRQFKRNFDLAVSQADHPEIFDGIRSEGEGVRLVKKTMGYLLKSKRGYLIPALIYKSACKYAGYCMGKRYRSLPSFIVERCSASPAYWIKR